MSSTVKDVAKLAGVSTATVSRVINNDKRISEKTKNKVMICIKELDYRINNVARSLKTNKTYTIGFICPEIPNEFFMTVAKGIEDELGKYGYSVLFCTSNEDVNQEANKIRLLCEKCVDGIIIIPVSSESIHFNKFNEFNIPLVLVDRLVNNFSADTVLVDNINGCYEAMEYLIKIKGQRSIGFIGGDIRLTSAKERFEGYKRALSDYSMMFDEKIVKFGDFHVQSGYSLMQELVNQAYVPNYVFISNYFMHVGATKYLIQNMKNTKYSISIASFDDMDVSSILGFCEVRVKQPMLEMGSRAVQLLLKRINHEELSFPQIIRLKTALIVNDD